MRAPAGTAVGRGAARIRLRARAVGEEERSPELNMTSMTDVIFILLIFFISLSEIRASRVNLDLPSVDQEGAQAADERKPVVVEITADGRVLLDGERREVRAIVAHLTALRERTGIDPRIRIRGDRTGDWGVVAGVLAGLSTAGLQRIEIEAQVAAGP